MGDLDRTIRRDHGSSEVQVFIRYLTGSKDYSLGQEQEIKKDRIEIGRASSCDIRFNDKQKTVSRNHATILREDRDWILKNTSDSNPTLINGRPLKKGWFLSSGDIIQLSYEGPKLEFIVKTIKKQETSPKKDLKEEEIFEEEAQQNKNNSSTYKEASSGWIIAGFIFAVLGGWGGMVLGINYIGGNYKKEVKQQGWIMLIISVIRRVLVPQLIY